MIVVWPPIAAIAVTVGGRNEVVCALVGALWPAIDSVHVCSLPTPATVVHPTAVCAVCTKQLVAEYSMPVGP